MQIYSNILDMVGRTPMLEVSQIDTGPCRLFLKLELMNPGGSIKDRVAKSMIEAGEANAVRKRVEHAKLAALFAFLETASCRRQALLGYFGERLAKDCGNCDVCLNPPETYDATVDAQKALSCVYRVEQRFVIGKVSDRKVIAPAANDDLCITSAVSIDQECEQRSVAGNRR